MYDDGIFNDFEPYFFVYLCDLRKLFDSHTGIAVVCKPTYSLADQEVSGYVLFTYESA